MSSQLKDLLPLDEKGVEKEIVDKLLSDENLESKTDLDNPMNWAILETIQALLERKLLKKSAHVLEHFRLTAFKYLISKNRLGRKEIIDALQALTNTSTTNSKVENNAKTIESRPIP